MRVEEDLADDAEPAQADSLSVRADWEQGLHDLMKLVGLRLDDLPHQPIQGGGRLDHFPGHHSTVPVGDFLSEHPLEEGTDKSRKSFGGWSAVGQAGVSGEPDLRQFALNLQDLAVKSRLIPEMIVDCGNVRAGPLADFSDCGVLKANPREDIGGHLEQRLPGGRLARR